MSAYFLLELLESLFKVKFIPKTPKCATNSKEKNVQHKTSELHFSPPVDPALKNTLYTIRKGVSFIMKHVENEALWPEHIHIWPVEAAVGPF